MLISAVAEIKAAATKCFSFWGRFGLSDGMLFSDFSRRSPRRAVIAPQGLRNKPLEEESRICCQVKKKSAAQNHAAQSISL